MKTFTNSFSFNRFKSAFCWLLAINKHKIIKMFVLTLVTTLIFVAIMRVWRIPGETIASVLALSFYFGIMLLAFNILSPIMKTRSLKMQFLSMPASNPDKFFATISLLIVEITIILLAFFLGDFIRIIFGNGMNDLMIYYLQGNTDNLYLLFGISFTLLYLTVCMYIGISLPKFRYFCLVLVVFFSTRIYERIPSVLESHSLLSIFPQEIAGYGGIIGCLWTTIFFFVVGSRTLFMNIMLNDDFWKIKKIY